LPQVRVVPAFIEWDIASDDGPIFHPPPPPAPAVNARAEAVAAAEAALSARASNSGSRSGRSGGIPRNASASSDLGAAGTGEVAAGNGGPNLSARSASLAERWRHGISWRPSLSLTGGGPRDASHHGGDANTHAGAVGSVYGSPPGGSRLRAVSMGSTEGSGRGGRPSQVFPDSDYFNRQLFG